MASYIELSELNSCYRKDLISDEVARLRSAIHKADDYMVWLLENDPGDNGTTNAIRIQNKANKEMLESIMNYYNHGQEET